MKALIIIIGVLLGVFLGAYPGLTKPKYLWQKIVFVAAFAASISLSILPPIAGNFSDAFYLSSLGDDRIVNVKINPSKFEKNYDEINKRWRLDYLSENEDMSYLTLAIDGEKLPKEFNGNNKLVIKTSFNKLQQVFKYHSTASVNPLITFPYIIELEEKFRLLFFHVPCAWASVLAYLISMAYAILFIKKKDLDYDLISSTSASIGLMFTILATITGMIWAKFNWGAYWNWDPRETSIFVLLLIYFAYFGLRQAIDNRTQRAKLSSVYAIIAFVAAVFLIFVFPRITGGLHPGSAGDISSGPILSAPDKIDYAKNIAFSLSLMSFTMLYFWIMNISTRLKALKYKLLMLID